MNTMVKMEVFSFLDSINQLKRHSSCMCGQKQPAATYPHTHTRTHTHTYHSARPPGLKDWTTRPPLPPSQFVTRNPRPSLPFSRIN